MLVFQVALPEEIKDFKKLSKNFNVHNSFNRKYYLFENDSKINYVVTFSGVGKTNSASCITDIIRTFTPSHIINIGLCGSSTEKIKELDVCLVDKCFYLDVDATAVNYQLGQVPQEKPFFETNQKLNESIKDVLNSMNIEFKNCNLGTSDSFIDKNNYLKFSNEVFDKVSIFDMEGTSFAHVSQKMGFECSVIKIVSDCFLNLSSSKDQFEKNLENGSQLIFKIIKNIANHLNKK